MWQFSRNMTVVRDGDDLSLVILDKMPFPTPGDPLHDEAFVDTLARAYVRAPTVF